MGQLVLGNEMYACAVGLLFLRATKCMPQVTRVQELVKPTVALLSRGIALNGHWKWEIHGRRTSSSPSFYPRTTAMDRTTGVISTSRVGQRHYFDWQFRDSERRSPQRCRHPNATSPRPGYNSKPGQCW